MAKTDDIKYRFEIESVDPISPHNEALYEMGKEMLKSSITTVRDFCKFMINISMGVIPIYLGVLKLVLPKNITLSPTELLSFMISPLLFIISAIIFT